MDRNQWRLCKAINCGKLNGMDCTVEECEHPDKKKALEDRRAELRAVKHV